MSTLPKLALIPSGYKASKVYSVLPTDGVGDFDFSRSGQATRINKNGLIETVGSNVPRLNYPMIDGVVSGCPSLLLEPQRTNLITQSETLSNVQTANATRSNSDIISPSGSVAGFKITEVASNVYQSILYTNISYTSGTSYSISVFAKKGTNDRFVIFGQTTSQPLVGFDLTNGVVISQSNVTSSFIEPFGNDWYRCGFSYTSSATQTSQFGINLIKEGTTSTYIYIGDINQYIYFYGAQLEAGSYATSYIPTNGSQVTRVAETANGAGDANTFNDSEGVLFAEISALANDGTFRAIALSDGTLNNNFILYFTQITNQVRVISQSSGVRYVDSTTSVSNITNNNKIALKYKQNDFALWINGVKVLTDLSFLTPIGLNILNFDVGTGIEDFYGNTKQLQYFDSALNDSDLETLTSWTSFSEMATSQLYTIE